MPHKEKQLSWNLKSHTILSTIFSPLILTLNCYSDMVSFGITKVCLEWPFGKKYITQGPNHRFTSQINLLVPIRHETPPNVICKYTLVGKYGSNKDTPQRHPKLYESFPVSLSSSTLVQIWLVSGMLRIQRSFQILECHWDVFITSILKVCL